jgi:predicted nucleic acid-binding protein
MKPLRHTALFLAVVAGSLVASFCLPVVAIAWVDEALHAEAREALLGSGRRHVSLVDWTSFLVMRRHGVARAFAFDPDFREQGFEVLPWT